MALDLPTSASVCANGSFDDDRSPVHFWLESLGAAVEQCKFNESAATASERTSVISQRRLSSSANISPRSSLDEALQVVTPSRRRCLCTQGNGNGSKYGRLAAAIVAHYEVGLRCERHYESLVAHKVSQFDLVYDASLCD